jgi:hypothetical protein
MNKASAIHATCEEEMQHIRNLGVKSPIAVIPNPVNIACHSRESGNPLNEKGIAGQARNDKVMESAVTSDLIRGGNDNMSLKKLRGENKIEFRGSKKNGGYWSIYYGSKI